MQTMLVAGKPVQMVAHRQARGAGARAVATTNPGAQTQRNQLLENSPRARQQQQRNQLAAASVRQTPKIPLKEVSRPAQDQAGMALKSSPAARHAAGSLSVMQDFYTSPASRMAENSPQLNDRLATGLQQDAATLVAATPGVQAGMSANGLVEVPAATPPPLLAAPEPEAWAAPATVARPDVPRFVASAGADPDQASQQVALEGRQVSSLGNQTQAELATISPQAQLPGRELTVAQAVPLQAATGRLEVAAVPGMSDYLAIGMPAGIRQQVDEQSASMFSQSLAAPRQQMQGAATRREQAQEQAQQQTRQQAHALGKQASQDQALALNQARQNIGAERDQSLAESKATLEEYNGKVGREKQNKINQINDTIVAHEKRADGVLAEADAKVANERQSAESKKAEAEGKAAERKKDRKWWQKAGDFFSDIASSLASAVTGIMHAVAAVIKRIVAAARALANSIIDACTGMVRQLLESFAAIITGFLQVALATFPEIRARLNAAIRHIVSRVAGVLDKIGAALHAAVNQLCDALGRVIDFAHNLYVSLVQGALQLLQAALSGDFAALPRIAFMTACKALGLPGEKLWAIVLRARDQAAEIIKNPGAFLGNLIKAGSKGFSQFAGNIRKHVMSGLTGWLLGQVAHTGITLPETFDGPGLFMLVRQVLGVTWEYVRQRAVGIIGEENMARAEMVFGYLKRLFTEGPGALWAALKEKAVELKDSFIGQIEQWAVSTVVEKAVIKVISMLVPGAGYVQAILGMWQTLQVFIEKIKEIAAVVNSLLDSMAAITRGEITAAANFVEQTMAGTLPLVFTWLAKLIGIDGIGAKIKSIIDKLRMPVDKAVDFVVHGAVKLGKSAVKKVKGAASSVANGAKNWWQRRYPFTTRRGEKHELYFEGEGKQRKLMMASTPMDLLTILGVWMEMPRDPSRADPDNSKLKKCYALVIKFMTCPPKDEKMVASDLAKIKAHVEILADIYELGPVKKMDEYGWEEMESIEPNFEIDDSGAIDILNSAERKIQRIKGRPLFSDGPVFGPNYKRIFPFDVLQKTGEKIDTEKGFDTPSVLPILKERKYDVNASKNTSIYAEVGGLNKSKAGTGVGKNRPTDWDKFVAMIGTKNNKYVQGHSLSQRLGGLGNADNLSPFTRSLNGLHSNRVEQPIIGFQKKTDQYLDYNVKVNYAGNAGISALSLGQFKDKSLTEKVVAMTAVNLITAADAVDYESKGLIDPPAEMKAYAFIEGYVNAAFPSSIVCTVKLTKKTTVGANVGYYEKSQQIITLENKMNA